MVYIYYSYFIMVMSLFMFFMSLNLCTVKLDFMIEWLIFSFNTFMIELFILIDWVSCLFISVVMFITSMVVLYSAEYMSKDKSLDRFMYLIMLFVSSMVLMILSPSLISILFGWDMLGLVSYCLVIYYQNYSSFNSGMVTVLSNRIGDVGLLIALGVVIMYGSWNMYLLNNYDFLMLMLMLAGITKSAQIPFSSWLPLAMAAPTPVSSLVHSSTLVTAGVYLIMRFSECIVKSFSVSLSLLILSIFTMFMSGLMANFEFDLKKIIALSTLSQLGLMMIIMSLGYSLLGFYHLLTHAVFKSLLFLCAGLIIHSTGDNQDIRYYGNLSSMMPYVSMSFIISVLALMGFPFLAGFYSKDLIIEMIYYLEISMVYLMLIVMSLSLTVWYSLRLCYYLFFSNMKFESAFLIAEGFLMNMSMILLSLMSVIFGSILNWLFFFDLTLIIVNMPLKGLMYFMLMLGVCLSLINFSLVYFSKGYNVFSSNMWFLNLINSSLHKNFISLAQKASLIDQEWVEMIEARPLNDVKFIMMKVYYYKYKLYYIVYSHLFLFMVLAVFSLL
ncbi:nad5 (mitochondrion) [Ooceraea biroi]|uniref:NADH-ubiquinone oxidoreductase chain 5 n=1 Tax=Ooceraea biroi TaxID=2015173 RepID=A0A3L8D321_OOCBI|nr:nad5 [Ooceraea biroi]